MKTAKHTHEAFDGTTVVKGWVLEDGYGNKSTEANNDSKI